MKNPQITWNPPNIKSKLFEYDWQANYAAVVHNGSFGNEVRVFPRPWVYKTVNKTDITELFYYNFLHSKDINIAFRETGKDLGLLFTESIETKDWYYPTKTYRQNGDIVTSPRDIVDLGNLRDSLVSRLV